MEHNRLAELRKQAGLTQQQLAEKLGVTQQTVYYYENGRREMKSSVLIAISKALGCTVSDLLGIETQQGIVRAVKSNGRQLPLVGRIAAGTAREAIGIDGETHDTPESLWERHRDAFWLVVAGNSMNRLFAEGTLVLIDPDEEVRNGDVAVVFVNGDDATLKRVFFEGDVIRLHPESYDPDYRDRTINKNDPDAPSVRVLGKAVSYTAPDGWRA